MIYAYLIEGGLVLLLFIYKLTHPTIPEPQIIGDTTFCYHASQLPEGVYEVLSCYSGNTYLLILTTDPRKNAMKYVIHQDDLPKDQYGKPLELLVKEEGRVS